MNYIDDLATKIAKASDAEELPGSIWFDLYRFYALLALAKGAETTSKDVHDAWAAWRAATHPDHRSLVPFDQLSPEVQVLDDQYRDAIRAVAAEIR